MKLDKQETAVILAALRLWQRSSLVPGELERIATNDGEHSALDAKDIDDLCERINCAEDDEGGEMRTNFYYCADCNVSWNDEWSCACDDECPGCGSDFSPFECEAARDAAANCGAS